MLKALTYTNYWTEHSSNDSSAEAQGAAVTYYVPSWAAPCPIFICSEGDQCRDHYRPHTVCSPTSPDHHWHPASQSQKQSASAKLEHDTTVTTVTLATYAADLARLVSN